MNHIDILKQDIQQLADTIHNSIETSNTFSEKLLYAEIMNTCLNYIESHRSKLVDEFKNKLPEAMSNHIAPVPMLQLQKQLELFKDPMYEYKGDLGDNNF